MGNHVSGEIFNSMQSINYLQSTEDQEIDPKQNWESLQAFVQKLNRLAHANRTYLKVNFDIEELNIQVALSDNNLLPKGLRQFVFTWCGSGTEVLITLRRCGGMTSVRKYETVSAFIEDTRGIDDNLGFLKSVNKEFKELVKSQRSKALEESKDQSQEQRKSTEDDDFNLCGICFAKKIEIVLFCGHSFCEQCIADWTKKQTNCPMCRFDHQTTAFLIVENSMQQTVAIRSELLQKLRNMISTLIKMQPVAVDLSRFSDPNAKIDLSLLLGGKEKEFIDDAEFIEDPDRKPQEGEMEFENK